MTNKGNVVVEFSIVPIGTAGTSLSSYVARAFEVVKDRCQKYQLTPMGTIFEAESIEQAFSIVRDAHEAVIEAGAPRALTIVRIDDRRDREMRMEEKIKAVEEKIRSKAPHL